MRMTSWTEPARGAPARPAERVQVQALSAAQRTGFGRRTVLGAHNLQRCGLFGDAPLVELLDRLPRCDLHAVSMGADATGPGQLHHVRTDGVAGAELLRAVRNGRLWLNLARVDRAGAPWRQLVDDLYAQLALRVPGFEVQSSHGNLLISSPQAFVGYHADGPASVLWHLRGRKRVWVYPAGDERLAPREAMEDIVAGVRDEYLPYEPRWDARAEVHDLEPGQWMAWQQNAPHRICNLGELNVSLATEHFTAATRRHAHVLNANRWLRLRFGQVDASRSEYGAGALLKTLAHRIVRRVGLDPVPPKQHTDTMRIDADAPGGAAPLDAALAPRQAQRAAA